MKKFLKLFTVALVAVIALTGCGNKNTGNEDSGAADSDKVYKVGVVGTNEETYWLDVQKRLAEEGVNIEIVVFTDYNTPNDALAAGDLDLNAFQHYIFLDSYNADKGTDLVAIAETIRAPLGIYSNKIKDISELQDKATVAIPNDATNGGRSLLLLQSAGLLSLDPAAGLSPTVNDIIDNPKNLVIQELDASQTPRALDDVDLSIINGGMAADAGLYPQKDAIYLEEINEASQPYINIIAARQDNKDNPDFQKIIAAFQTDETAVIIDEASNGANIPAWK